MTITVKEIADRFNVNPLAAQKLLDFLREAKLAEVTGTVPKVAGQKGKPANVWSVPANIVLDFAPPTAPPVTFDTLVNEPNEKLAA